MAVTLEINNQIYSRWTEVRVTRSLKRACAAFEIATPGEIDPPILPFASCTLAADGEPVIAGYVDVVRIEVSARETRTRVVGRSKTADLIDCMLVPFQTNQFSGSALDAIARAVAAPFGVVVVVGPGVVVGDPFADATFEWSEPAFRFLNRLAKQRGVLLTDDENGNLVLATLGTANAPAALATGPGGNVFQAHGELAGQQRYSQYVIRSQQGLVHTKNGQVATQIEGQAADGGVPRYRPWGGIAESALGTEEAQTRAGWEQAHRLGGSIRATLSVPEWRAGAGANGGQLWRINQLVECTVPRLGLADTLLIGAVDFHEDGEGGRRTELTCAPPSAFTPKPQPGKAAGTTWAGIHHQHGGHR
ncbi:MAG TPA: hypothetical protein VGM07_06180 [Stellaceae bacterium]